MIQSQPWFLKLDLKVVYEDEDFVVVDKPFDLRMDIPKSGGRKWAGEYTIWDWLKQEQPGLDKIR